jgi:hypothetical protein
MSSPEPIFVPTVPVLANATVEMVKAGPTPTWDVHVWGEEPHDHRRAYLIKAKDDTSAAFEGIRLFVEEMTDLYSNGDVIDMMPEG